MDLEFFDTILEHSFIPLYGLVVLLALWRYPKYFDTPLRYLPILLMYTFLNELLGYFFRNYDDIVLLLKDIYFNNNWVIFNIYNIIFFLFFYYVFWRYISNEKRKKFILLGALAFIITSIVNVFFQSFTTLPQLYAYIVGGTVLMFSIVFYYEHLKASYQTYFLKKDLLSWLGLGMLIFYIGYIPIKITRYYYAQYGLGEDPFRRTHLLLIIIMYTCFAIGLVRMRKLRPIES